MPMPARISHRKSYVRVAERRGVVVTPGFPDTIARFSLALPSWRVVDAAGYSEAVREGEPVRFATVVSDDVTATVADVNSAIRTMQSSFRGIPCAVYVPIADVSAREIFKLQWWKETGVLFAGLDDRPSTATAALASVRAAHVWRLVSGALPSGIPDWLGAALLHVISRACASLTVNALHKSLGGAPRTINDRCRRMGLRNSENLVLWGRVFVAAYELGHRNGSFSEIAEELNYHQAKSLRAVIRARLGCTARDLVGTDALGIAIGRFVRALRVSPPRCRIHIGRRWGLL